MFATRINQHNMFWQDQKHNVVRFERTENDTKIRKSLVKGKSQG